ncbi:uncharacterized protein SCHCODRAFT_02669985 [Schizophyllum commune H4-8]|nr:uncharacterized protein SCHCODRAFT_02669985 [Schizophyllum commune H4-8]KAI5888915.1 hypothetical protein SCHCODRAFT_02669985 [Schizophyllum commune H4-8]
MGGQVFYAFFTAPVIVTNLAATALVGVKTWVYRRQIAVWLGPSSGDSRVGRVLMLLLESGLAFCGACVSGRTTRAQIVLNIIEQITLTVVTFMDVRFGFIIFTFMRSFLQGFAGIYATLVILMVAAQEHLTSDPALAGQSSFLASIRFLSHDEEPED